PVLAICGGCQMLGEAIEDPERVESEEGHAMGLGLLPLRTRFEREKRTTQVRAPAQLSSFLGDQECGEVSGYGIHRGRIEGLPGAVGLFEIRERNGRSTHDSDGAASENGAVLGTMIHGLFENESVRRSVISKLRRSRGLTDPPKDSASPSADEFDRLAATLR